MLNPSSGTTTKEAFIAAIRSGSPVHMRFTQPGYISITDADFHEDGLIFRDILNSDTDLTIGKSVKKEIAFKLIGVSPSINFNAEFTAEIGVEINGSTAWVTLGKFTAVYPDNYVDESVSEYVAYDRMSRFDVPADEWLKSLTYPMTVQQMFESLCSYVGLTGEIGNALTNMKSRSFSSAPIQNLGLMCRDVLELIAEACGCYAVITNEGNCKLKWYSIASYTEGGSNVVYTVSGDEIFDRKQKNYLTMVSGLNVKQAEDDVGVLYPSTATNDIYVIVDNPFLVTADSTEEDNYIVPLYNRLRNGNVMHYPTEVTCVGNPLIEAGDIIYANTSGSTTMWFPIYVKEMHWNGSLTDVYYSTGSIHRQSYTSAIKQKLSQGGRYHIFKNTVDQLYSELYDPATGDISILDQRATALELSVADKYSIVSGIGITSAGVEVTGSKYVKIISGGSFYVDATDFRIDSANKAVILGDWRWNDDGLSYYQSVMDWYFTLSTESTVRQHNNDQISGIDPSYGKIKLISWHPYQGSYSEFTFLQESNGDSYLNFPTRPGTGKNVISRLDEIVPYTTLRVDNTVAIYESTGSNTARIYLDPVSDDGRITTQGIICKDYVSVSNGGSKYISMYASNGVVSAFGFTNLSSRKAKHNIVSLAEMGDVIDRLDPVSFVYNGDDDEQKRFGLIYEDTIDILPEICVDTGKNKTIDYVELVPVLLKEIQSLRKRVASLENPTN